MPLVLDTFNVLHTTGVLPPDLAGLDVPGLAALILRSRYASERVTFVCDGLPAADLPPAGRFELADAPAGSSELHVRYSGRGATADDLIRQMIDASTAPRRLIIVSTDHAIQRHAHRRRCVALTSADFLQHLADDANLPRPATAPTRRPTIMSTEQIEKWKHLFKVDDAVAAALAPPGATDLPRENPSKPAAPSAVGQTNAPPLLDQNSVPLPADLIAEAEALVQSAGRSPTPVEGKNLATPSQAVAPRASDQSHSPSTASASSDGNAFDKREITTSDTADIDLSSLDTIDMESILPADGQTRRLPQKDRRRPPAR